MCIVEFGDFECPYCAGAAPVLRELVSSSEGRLRLVFRNFPLFEVHPHSLTAALAAESVAATGGEEAYWHMHDKLFAQQARLTDADLQLYAKATGGDPDLAVGEKAQQFAPIVQADYAAGIAVGCPAPRRCSSTAWSTTAGWRWRRYGRPPVCQRTLPNPGADHGSGGRAGGAVSPAGEQRLVRSPITRNTQAPIRAAISEPVRIPIFAWSRSASSSKASSVMNSEMVNPIPASTAPPNKWL